MDVRIGSDRVGGTHVLALEGVADLSAVPTLHRALAAVCDEPALGTVAVDLDALTVLDDVAAGLLLGAAARVRDRGGELVLVCSTERIGQRLAHLRLDRVMRVTDSIAAAGRA